MSSFRRLDIQGLRALAVGLVIAGHAGVPGTPGGFIGVDVFFVISGFLITGLLLREIDRDGRVSISRFYVRRALRILPAATVTMVSVLVASALLLPEHRTESIAGDSVWSAAFMANIHFALDAVDYFNTEAPSPLQHYWSLSVEEQFYVVWPLAVLVAALLVRASTRASATTVIATMAATVVVVSVAWSIYATATSPATSYFSTFARAHELAIGALLACLLRRRGPLNRRVAAVLGVLGAGALVFAAVTFSEHLPFPGALALVPVIGTAALLVAGPETPTGRILSVAPLRYLGDLSYSLYLWHWPVLILVPELLPGGGWPVALGEIVLVLVLSMASYHWIEQPFLQRRLPVFRGGPRTLVLWPVALVIALVAGLGAQTYSGFRADQRAVAAEAWFQSDDAAYAVDKDAPLRKQLRAALALADRGAPVPPGMAVDVDDVWAKSGYGCAATYGDTVSRDCVYGDKEAKRVAVVIGDSHAGMWLPALDLVAKRERIRLVAIIKHSCPTWDVATTSDKLPDAECDAFREWTMRRLTTMRPDTIIVGTRAGLESHPGDTRNLGEQWETGVASVVDRLTGISADVRVLADIPSRPDPVDCLASADQLEDCVTVAAGIEIERNQLTRRAINGTSARFIPIVDLMCTKRCPLVVGESILYQDLNHVTASWAKRVVDDFAERLGPLGDVEIVCSDDSLADVAPQPGGPAPSHPCAAKVINE
ncbi:acyltransferase family protein [Nocardioides sp. NPDC006303]|uniref:acyltransferase family protein n=1 Tax=Nocardioides sp. NPDC006303 TaxID=3156747 RepID=UPI0033AC14A2